MRRVALVTYAGLPGLSADDRLLLAPLAARDIRGEPAAWDDPTIAWGQYDALVVRSTWNYHTAFDAFLAWISVVEGIGVLTWNPPPMLRWNANKAYLQDLSAAGVEVVPTCWVERRSIVPLREVLAEVGWPDVVIKPAVSASAHETWRVMTSALKADDELRFRRLTALGEVMVQPFLPELARDGEWSLMFIAGEYSHAVLKRPRVGDFRVQHEHGGSAEPRTPPDHVLSGARAITTRIPGRWLYARVDGVDMDGRFLLGELELLEPSLFLAADPVAPDRFASAIARGLEANC